MSKSKVIWVVLGSLVLVVGLVAGVMLVFRNQNLKNKAAPATTLSIVPGSQNKSPDNPFSLALEMNTGGNRVATFDFIINFDPQIFQVDSVAKDSSLSDFVQIRNSIDSSAGKIYYSAYTVDQAKVLNGSGLTVLNISAMVKSGAAAGTYNFSFDSGTIIGGWGENQNALTNTTPGSVVVAAGAATATPTPTPTSTLTATPTATPTGLPNGTPTPTRPPIPVSGTSLPTVIGVIVGAFAVIGSLLLAL
ncbi:MAG: cohesin domain-containing protein [Candidatus Woesebacteria bacterium]|nr:cohesin domain-containing protein [Candidatus Woesebacteria bacterium]